MTGGVVVVLGPTGRNFAAGMSGGLAYVLDETGHFAQRANRAMVALEPLNDVEETLKVRVPREGWRALGRAELPEDWLRHDALRLQILVARHFLYTGSEPARRILENWSEWLPRFVKVLPQDFRRALREMQQPRACADLPGEQVSLAA
jgi:glutamate synthase (NADPH/NADH) large chain